MPPPAQLHCTACIVGGGPAGVMLGFLLARAGIKVLVLEKHADFLRDFRGDTVHPSTLEVIHELGLLDEFLKRPHQELTHLDAQVAGTQVTVGDFSHLPTRCKFVAFMPQWDFLDFMVEQARAYPSFDLRMQAQVTDLIYDRNRVVGVHAETTGGPLEVRADLVVGADGRSSTVRERAGLKVLDLGAPMDVLWMRISKGSSDPDQTFGFIGAGKIIALIDRGNYWQLAYVIPKGSADRLRQHGLPALRESIAELVPFLRDRLSELRDWNDIRLLTVLVDRLQRWHRPGLLCIGDAAHAMSPIGGIGINLAIQDAVAAANILALPLRTGALSTRDLHAVQVRREPPTRLTQAGQVFIQNRVIRRVLATRAPRTSLPLLLRLLRRFPHLRRIPARLIGIGVRPEHVAAFLRTAPTDFSPAESVRVR